MLIAAAVIVPVATIYVGVSYGWVYIGTFLKVLASLQAAVIAVSLIAALVMSASAWPSATMLQQTTGGKEFTFIGDSDPDADVYLDGAAPVLPGRHIDTHPPLPLKWRNGNNWQTRWLLCLLRAIWTMKMGWLS